MYTSGFASRLLWLSYISNVSSGSHGPVCRSTHLSGMMNGLTHLTAFAGDASAVAIAITSTVRTPKIGPISVGIGLSRAVVRYTKTRTRLFTPVGPVGNVTSPDCTDTA